MSLPDLILVTIGVYGFDEAGFFQALQNANVDTFIDLRQRRGMRGSKYAFANSSRLQARLAAMGIRYLHFKALAPPTETRRIQKQADQAAGVSKNERAGLSPTFIRDFEEKVLVPFDEQAFFGAFPPSSQTVALFCVEREPAACHRSLVAKYLSKRYGFIVKDIVPWKS